MQYRFENDCPVDLDEEKTVVETLSREAIVKCFCMCVLWTV